jgi:hypothetical protein
MVRLRIQSKAEKMIALGNRIFFSERIELATQTRNRRLHNGGRVMTYKSHRLGARKINKAEALLKEIKNTYEV